MKTEKEITKDEMNEALNNEVSQQLFIKKSCALYINVMPKNKNVRFSVIDRKTFEEEYFNLLGEAASAYTQRP